jgi:hypothetical protein
MTVGSNLTSSYARKSAVRGAPASFLSFSTSSCGPGLLQGRCLRVCESLPYGYERSRFRCLPIPLKNYDDEFIICVRCRVSLGSRISTSSCGEGEEWLGVGTTSGGEGLQSPESRGPCGFNLYGRV